MRDYDNQIGDPSIAAMDAQAAKAAEFLRRLDAIPTDSLGEQERVSAAILRRELQSTIAGNRFGQRLMLFSTYSGWHQGFAGMADNLPFATGADYRSYLARIAQYPAYNDEALRVSQMGVDQGYVCLLYTSPSPRD